MSCSIQTPLGDKLQSLKFWSNPVLSIEMERERMRCRRIEIQENGKWKMEEKEGEDIEAEL